MRRNYETLLGSHKNVAFTFIRQTILIIIMVNLFRLNNFLRNWTNYTRSKNGDISEFLGNGKGKTRTIEVDLHQILMGSRRIWTILFINIIICMNING